MTRIERKIVRYLIDKKKRESLPRNGANRRPTDLPEVEGRGWMPVFSVIPVNGRRRTDRPTLEQVEGWIK